MKLGSRKGVFTIVMFSILFGMSLEIVASGQRAEEESYRLLVKTLVENRTDIEDFVKQMKGNSEMRDTYNIAMKKNNSFWATTISAFERGRRPNVKEWESAYDAMIYIFNKDSNGTRRTGCRSPYFNCTKQPDVAIKYWKSIKDTGERKREIENFLSAVRWREWDDIH